MAVGSRIKGITIEIDGDTTKLTKAIKQSEDQIRQSTSGLKDINNLLKIDPGNTELLSQKYKLLQTDIDGCKTKLTTLKEAQQQMVREGKVGTDEYDKLQREIVETEQKIKSLTKEMRNFGSVSAQQIAAAGEKVKKVGDGMQNVGQKLMPVTAALTAAGTVSVQKFAEVDKTMTLTNQTMGNTKEQADLLNRAMKDAAMNSTFGMNDAAQASLNFARAGLTAEEAAAALAPSMNLAAGEGGNLDTVSAGLVATINGFGDSFNNTSHYADVFAIACNKSALDVDGLSEAMSIAAPVFKTAGYSVDDAALYMGVMANNGIEASEAANGLKTGLARLVAPAKQGKEAMIDLGLMTEDAISGKFVSAFTNADGSMKSSIEVQSILHDKFKDLSESEQIAAASAIFGKNQMSKWLALINTAPEDVQALSNEISNCEGTTRSMAEAMMSGFGGSLEKLKSSIDVASESLGEALAPTISKVADGIQKAVNWFNSLDSEQQTAIANALLLVAALGPVLIVGGKIVSGLGTIMTLAPKVVGGFNAITGAVGNIVPSMSSALPAITSFMEADIGGALAAGGATAVGTAAAAVGASIVAAFGGAEFGKMIGTYMFPDDAELYAHYAGISGTVELVKDTVVTFAERTQEHVQTAWGNVQEAGAVMAERTGEHLDNIKQSAGDTFNNVIEAGNTLKDRTSEHFETMKTNVGTSLDNVKEAAGTFVDRTNEHFENFKTKTGEVFTNVQEAAGTLRDRTSEHFETMKTNVGNAMSNLQSNVNDFKDKATSNFDSVKQKVSDLGSAAQEKFSSMQSHVSSAIDKVKSVLDSLKQKFDDIKSHISSTIDWLKGCFNFDWRLPDIKLPHFSVSGSFSLDPPSTPHFSVDWYAKAMEKGMILNSPTIFGAMGGRLLGAGEAGPEAVVGTSSLQSMITNAVAAGGYGGDIVIPIYLGNTRLQTMVVEAQKISDYRSGGR